MHLDGFSNLLRKLIPGIWLGVLVAVAFIAMPAAFATLDRVSAGALARRVFSWEAGVSLVFGLLVVMIERRAGLRRSEAEDAGGAGAAVPGGLLLAAGAMFCTVAGYYGLSPALDAARASGDAANFGRLHAVSTAFFGVKGLLVLALAWKAAR